MLNTSTSLGTIYDKWTQSPKTVTLLAHFYRLLLNTINAQFNEVQLKKNKTKKNMWEVNPSTPHKEVQNYKIKTVSVITPQYTDGGLNVTAPNSFCVY